GSVELRLDPDDGGLGNGASRQGTDQFALPGAGFVGATPGRARRLLRLLFGLAKQADLTEEGFQRLLLATAAANGKAFQGDVGGHRTISRISRRVSSTVARVLLA